MFTRKSILDKHGVRVPTVDEPWTADEYATLQQKIADSGDFKNVVDYGPSWTGEWWSYGFGTFLMSFGGDEIDRDGFESADGVLNGPESLKFAQWFQDQFADGYAAKSNSPDRTEFKEGKVAIQFNGNWEYANNFEKYGDDLVIAPAPDFGSGSVSGAGSWQYGLTKSCSEEQLAGGLEYLKFSLDDKYIAMYSDATSLIPATSTAAEQTTKGYYGPGEPLEVVSEIAANYAEVRPETPAYPVISQVFEKQLQDIMNGKDPQEGLDQMVSEIDADLASAGYDN
jgi:multiple sugar transport system substrate-binding protein